MRRPGGYAILVDPSAPTREADTFTCRHCQRIVHVRPLVDAAYDQDIGGLCKCCMGMICGPCVDKGTCTPFEKAFEKMEARARFLRSAGIAIVLFLLSCFPARAALARTNQTVAVPLMLLARQTQSKVAIPQRSKAGA